MADKREKNAHLWARHPEDWYVEPEWCSERLFEAEPFDGPVYDPSCGMGRIVEAARRAGYEADGNDVVKRWHEAFEMDFFEDITDYSNIVSNPPFGCADDYVWWALQCTLDKVALLLPTKWMNSAKRGQWLKTTPLKRVWLLTPRPSMPPGPVIEAGEKPGNGTVDFAWFVWEHGYEGEPMIGWLHRDMGKELL